MVPSVSQRVQCTGIRLRAELIIFLCSLLKYLSFLIIDDKYRYKFSEKFSLYKQKQFIKSLFFIWLIIFSQFCHASRNISYALKLNYKGGQTPSAHQERPGCFPGVFRQPLTPIMGSIPTFIPEMNTGFNLLNKK